MPSPAAVAKHPRVLLRFTPKTLVRALVPSSAAARGSDQAVVGLTDLATRFYLQRIPDELATEIGADEAFVVGPTGVRAKPWRVGVEWDGDGAFLGRGWREFAAACGVEPGWLLVLRHRGRGILTLKAFDCDGCLRELELVAQPPAGGGKGKIDSRAPPVLSQDVEVVSTKFPIIS
jgi:hypothetical protein